MWEQQKLNAQHRLWTGTAALWAGISVSGNLIAATAKFQVDALDLSIALQVGRAQFLWISYAEWFCIAMIVLGLIWNMRMMSILLMGAVGIFMIQQIGLTPILHARSDQIIAGLSPDHSNVHVIYAILEVMKFICLLIFSSRVLAAPVTLTALSATERKKSAF
jgi:hypothetical protein